MKGGGLISCRAMNSARPLSPKLMLFAGCPPPQHSAPTYHSGCLSHGLAALFQKGRCHVGNASSPSDKHVQCLLSLLIKALPFLVPPTDELQSLTLTEYRSPEPPPRGPSTPCHSCSLSIKVSPISRLYSFFTHAYE